MVCHELFCQPLFSGVELCSCEQDKATLEMESMEEGFLGKILVGDGGKDIPVGQVQSSLHQLERRGHQLLCII